MSVSNELDRVGCEMAANKSSEKRSSQNLCKPPTPGYTPRYNPLLPPLSPVLFCRGGWVVGVGSF